MRAPNPITHRLSERGASAWPFVITLLLLLVFVYMWFKTTDERDTALNDAASARKALQASKNTQAATAQKFGELSKAVGFLNDTIDPGDGSGAIQVTRTADLLAHVMPEGMASNVEGQEPVKGALNMLLTDAVIVFDREARLHDKQIGEEKAYDYSIFPAPFQEKVKSFAEKYAEMPTRPVQPSDPDDTAAMSQYEDDLNTYNAAMDEYRKGIAELSGDENWKKFGDIVKAPGTWGAATTEAVSVRYYTYPAGGANNVETLVQPLGAMLAGMKAELKAITDAYAAKIKQLEGELEARKTELEQSQTALSEEQGRATTRQDELTSELSGKNEQLTQAQSEMSGLSAELEKVKDNAKAEISKVSSERDAYREGLNNEKERRELRIRRDDPKGQILAVSQSLGTGSIDKGTAQRIYVGQKFVVSSIDRAGNRMNKGEIVITNVTGRHSAKFRIESQVVTIAGGDRIHNPFHNPEDPMHVVIHGTLDKWTRELAVARLAQLGVTVQSKVDGDTDYIVISNSLSAPTPAASGGEDDEGDDEEQGAAGTSELEKLWTLARKFGAVVIPERLFDTFLDY